MGTTDKITRVIIALIIGLLYFTNIITGTLAILLGTIAILFIAISLISFCPFYVLFGINTCKNNKE